MRITKDYISKHKLVVFRGYIDGFVDGKYVLYQILCEHRDYYQVYRRD